MNSSNVESNRDRSGRFLPGTHWRKHAIFRERDYLVREYQVRGRSASEIAAEHGVTDGAVLFWLKRLTYAALIAKPEGN
jgi:transposase-like protein